MLSNALLLAQAENAPEGPGIVPMLFIAVIAIAIIAGFWKMFEKAGKPGWASIIPIYNLIVILEIVGRPIWWIILYIIPCAGIIVSIVVCIDLAKSFGKGTGYGLGIVFLGFIFIPLLGFGDAKYIGPVAKS